jgi:hypothetical protein
MMTLEVIKEALAQRKFYQLPPLRRIVVTMVIFLFLYVALCFFNDRKKEV